ncbi:MAG: hypothetical protein IJX16_06250 [Clostridia bacterium]|nr:hypothetical protein [Clostridia bacterium]
MSRRARTLVTSFLSMLLAVAILAGATYALFSTQAVIKGHLVAGNMQMKLERLAIKDGNIDNIDTLEWETASKDFTNDSTSNVFSKDGVEDPTIIAKGLIGAKMKISHATSSNVAFEYYVKIVIDESQSDMTLADSLDVVLNTGVGENETKVSASLDKDGVLSTQSSPIKVYTTGSSEFEVIVSLPDVDGEGIMGKHVYFDLVVVATQIND